MKSYEVKHLCMLMELSAFVLVSFEIISRSRLDVAQDLGPERDACAEVNLES